MSEKTPLLEVRDLKKHFPVAQGSVKAVDGVSMEVRQGETVGLVGESGCGKSTLGRTILGLYEATAGQVFLEGKDVLHLSGSAWSQMRTEMQIIFQDPASSLNPIMTTGRNIQEALAIHHRGTHAEQVAEVDRLLDQVGIGAQFSGTFPYELSIGQQQRVAIARAVALRPKFIVCDEPISSLDLSIQGQIIDLLLRLQDEYGLAYLFISHDLRVVQFLSHRIAVMYLGRIVERGTSDAVYNHAAHPYSRALLSAVPEIPNPEDEENGGRKKERVVLTGEPPSPLNPPTGCPFHPRCRYCMDICKEEFPPTVELAPDHRVACYLYTEHGKGQTGFDGEPAGSV